MSNVSVTRDGFLDNRIAIEQPRKGFRAGHDSVLLAASVPASSGQSVLELGSGAGVASLCLAARVPGLRILGIEIDEALVALANANAERNAMNERVRFAVGDAEALDLQERFDHAFFNPPFHPASGQVSPVVSRDRAMRDTQDASVAWARSAAPLLRENGTITAILRPERLDAWYAAVVDGAAIKGAVLAKPLQAREGEPAKRVIVRLLPGTGRSLTLLAPIALHEEDGKPTRAAEAILRHGAALAMI